MERARVKPVATAPTRRSIGNSTDARTIGAPYREGVTDQLPLQRVLVHFVGTPPARLIALASGVSQVQIDGSTLRCLVHGSFQPFLEALRGHEVLSLESISSTDPTSNFIEKEEKKW